MNSVHGIPYENNDIFCRIVLNLHDNRLYRSNILVVFIFVVYFSRQSLLITVVLATKPTISGRLISREWRSTVDAVKCLAGRIRWFKTQIGQKIKIKNRKIGLHEQQPHIGVFSMIRMYEICVKCMGDNGWLAATTVYHRNV